MPAYDSVTAVMNIGKADAGYRIGRMYDGMVADIDGYMAGCAKHVTYQQIGLIRVAEICEELAFLEFRSHI